MTAFQSWAKANFTNDPESLAAYLLQCIERGSAEMVWALLKLTGDVEYCGESFLKAAHLLLSDEALELG